MKKSQLLNVIVALLILGYIVVTFLPAFRYTATVNVYDEEGNIVRDTTTGKPVKVQEDRIVSMQGFMWIYDRILDFKNFYMIQHNDDYHLADLYNVPVISKETGRQITGNSNTEGFSQFVRYSLLTFVVGVGLLLLHLGKPSTLATEIISMIWCAFAGIDLGTNKLVRSLLAPTNNSWIFWALLAIAAVTTVLVIYRFIVFLPGYIQKVQYKKRHR